MAAAKGRQSSPRAGAKPGRREMPAAVLYLRVDFGEHGALGPGETRLMELIAETGSISAAGRAMGMSYRRAWLLVDALNVAFGEPLVAKQTGGSGGGGAVLTKLGREVVSALSPHRAPRRLRRPRRPGSPHRRAGRRTGRDPSARRSDRMSCVAARGVAEGVRPLLFSELFLPPPSARGV